MAIAAAAAPETLATVEVVATTPMQGLQVPLDWIPANVQSLDSAGLQRAAASSLADAMRDSFASVSINEAQANPYQPDVSFRGFEASPLLGNPIGMSVFVDGVRINEPFGDTVLWDLIPTAALERVTLVPGANPVFGLNTLGGALALQTKSGRSQPGMSVEFAGGSFARRSAQLTAGGAQGRLDGFVALEYDDERGWRDRSPSLVRRLFAKGAWRGAATEVELTYTVAANVLTGNGLVPRSLLDERRAAVYTYPDRTDSDLGFANLRATHELGAGWLVTAQAYSRRLEIATFNGDAEFAGDAYEAENRRTRTHEHGSGAAMQVVYSGDGLRSRHHLAVGVSTDRGRVAFDQLEQEARFTADRGTIGEGAFELATAVHGGNDYDGLFVSDTFELNPRAHATLAARYNRARIAIVDRSGEEPALNGRHSFDRIDPAAGLTFAVTPRWMAYAGYDEGFRAPTAVELTCADPQAPCALPVSFVADPPLDPVIARSWEVGIRSVRANRMRWNLTGFTTELANDILFTAVGASRGFFANVPATRRRGGELSLATSIGLHALSLDYSYVDATYRSAVRLFNPLAAPSDPQQPATLDVVPGDRLPGIPRHMLKIAWDWRPRGSVTIGARVVRYSSRVFRGGETATQPPLAGYTLLGLRAQYRVSDSLHLYARIDNVLDKSYATLGAFNRNAFDDDSEPLEGVGPGPVERFLSPGAPRNFWVGLKWSPADRD